jgi:hypothetical protein
MLDDLIKAYGDKFLVAALGVSLALLCLFIVLWILRNRAPSPFVRGGRNRQPRLQVLDAAAIDTRRRIVLIRRDNVEHLVMIGGPTDIVIESGIGDERPYLSVRPTPLAAIEEPPELPQQDKAAPLAPTPAESTMIAAPAIPVTSAAAVAAPTDIVARAPLAPEPVRAEPPRQPARSQPSVPPPVEPRRVEPAIATTAEPAAERRPSVSPVLPAAAIPTAAVVTDAPIAVATARHETAATPPTAVEIQAIEEPSVSEPPSMGPAPEVTSPALSVARSEPILIVREPAVGQNEVHPVSIDLPTAPASPPIEPPRREPVEPVMLEQPITQRHGDLHAERRDPQVVLPPVIDAPVAADLLEAARQRVLAPAPAFENQSIADARAVEPIKLDQTAPNAAPQARDISDFERVLEEEMALHLAADPAPVQKPAAPMPQMLPETRADRPRPPVAAMVQDTPRNAAAQTNPADQGQEPNLQTEIARIFGEMSASRNS